MPRITGRDRVAAILEDPAYVVPPAAPGPFGTLAWLRASVCRFAEGEDHARRRALVEARLAAVEAADLARAGSLALALGITDDVAADVEAVAAVYLTGGPGADDAVARLVDAVGPGGPEAVAADISILVQAARALAADVHAADRPGGRGRARPQRSPVRGGPPPLSG